MSTVMVTGASGYIAGWIVRYLLEAGHTVHATVRDPHKAASVDHLHAIADVTPGTLKLFKADLLDADSFDAPMAGCDVLMHTASPFVLDGFTDANEALVRPAVEGTRNVLNAANRCETLKRVVLTSSVASVYGDATDMKGKSAFTEADWNTTSTVDHNPYQYSKVAAEREAWKIHDAQAGEPQIGQATPVFPLELALLIGLSRPGCNLAVDKIPDCGLEHLLLFSQHQIRHHISPFLPEYKLPSFKVILFPRQVITPAAPVRRIGCRLVLRILLGRPG